MQAKKLPVAIAAALLIIVAAMTSTAQADQIR